jgi:hydrogenase maturation factor
MEITDKGLFSRLTYSCIGKKVDREELTFQHAKTAKNMGKDVIDREVMIKYFTSDDHRKVIELSYSKYGDFDKEECLARIGRVGGIIGSNVVVAASSPHVYKNTFNMNLGLGDYVLVHSGKVVEKLSAKEAELLG